MSYRCFVYYRSNGGPYTVTSKSLDGQPCSTQYDPEMVTPDYLMGINYPASLQVRTDLQSTDNRPARRRQFAKLLPGVVDVSTAKAAITYTDPANPLSVFGRWISATAKPLTPRLFPTAPSTPRPPPRPWSDPSCAFRGNWICAPRPPASGCFMALPPSTAPLCLEPIVVEMAETPRRAGPA